jgi:hypothetical protein
MLCQILVTADVASWTSDCGLKAENHSTYAKYFGGTVFDGKNLSARRSGIVNTTLIWAIRYPVDEDVKKKTSENTENAPEIPVLPPCPGILSPFFRTF